VHLLLASYQQGGTMTELEELIEEQYRDMLGRWREWGESRADVSLDRLVGTGDHDWHPVSDLMDDDGVIHLPRRRERRRW